MFFAIARPDEALDVLKTGVDVGILEKPLEQFTIEFSKDSLGVNMSMAWDKMHVSIPIK